MGYFGGEKRLEYNGVLFPKEGRPAEEVRAGINHFLAMDPDEVHGHTMAYAMTLMAHLDASRIANEAHMKFIKKNMILKELLPGTERMALEVKRMAIEMLGFPAETSIRLTAGGSESLYCGVNAALQWARVERPRIREPEVVVPYSMHAAVTKWCHYTGTKLKRIPLRPDRRADVAAMEAAIGPNTVLVMGSAPCWPFGLFDDIEGIAAVAAKHDIWMHVDGCLGGFFSPFAEKAGHKLPRWRFDLPGVRSISADLHKYGFSNKPLSTISFRNADLAKYHDFSANDWPDGPYKSESIMGSTTAASIASCWAVMRYLGETGYVELAKRSLAVKKRYEDGINAIEGFRAIESDLTPICFEVTGGLDAFAVLGGLFERQAYCLPCFQPPGIKIVVEPVTDEVVDTFVRNLREVTALVRAGKITIESIRPYL